MQWLENCWSDKFVQAVTCCIKLDWSIVWQPRLSRRRRFCKISWWRVSHKRPGTLVVNNTLYEGFPVIITLVRQMCWKKITFTLHYDHQWLTKDKNVFKGRGWEGRIELNKVEGREITSTLRQVWNRDKTAWIIYFDKKNPFLPFEVCVTQYFHGLDLLLTCLLYIQGMQMIFSMLFLIFTFKDANLAENLINLADTQKKNWTPQGSLG